MRRHPAGASGRLKPRCAHKSKKGFYPVGANLCVRLAQGGHIGPPLQEINYRFERKLGISRPQPQPLLPGSRPVQRFGRKSWERQALAGPLRARRCRDQSLRNDAQGCGGNLWLRFGWRRLALAFLPIHLLFIRRLDLEQQIFQGAGLHEVIVAPQPVDLHGRVHGGVAA